LQSRTLSGLPICQDRESPLFEITLVLVRFDHVVSIIVNANQKLGSILIDTVGFFETVHAVPKGSEAKGRFCPELRLVFGPFHQGCL
jgi:hypothetical protein